MKQRNKQTKITDIRDTKLTLTFVVSALFSVLICGVVFLLLFDNVQMKPEIFHDIIIENVAKSGTNKSGELNLFYGILILGIVLFCIIYSLIRHISRKKTARELPGEVSVPAKAIILLLIPNILRFMIYGDIHVALLGLLILAVIWSFLWKEYLVEILMLYLFTYYALVALLTVLCRFVSLPALTGSYLYIITVTAASFYLLLCRIKGSCKPLKNAIILIQLTFPCMLFVYFVDTYFYQGSFVKIPFAKGYTLFFLALCTFCYIYLLHHTIQCLGSHKRFKTQKINGTLPLKRIICKITPVILFIYNSFSASPMYAQPDQHHHGEQMIPWQQTITLSQSLYEEYSPVSGLFPFFSGGIQNLLLNGTISDYSPAISISMVIFCVITMWLLIKHVGTVYGVVFAVFFSLPCYNRQYFLLPVLLLLLLPKLLEKKNLWMKCWLLSCFLAGLYYPLYGGALVVGTLPLLIYQFAAFIKSGELKKVLHKPSFYLGWFVCIAPVILSIPLLLKMLKHTLTYSSQTILADGISLWGQSVPDYFMTHLSNPSIRYYCYFSLRFLLPAVGIWMFAFLLYHVLIFKLKDKNNTQNISYVLLSLTAGLVTLLVSYSYTLVRADQGMILSRTSYVLIAVTGMFLPVLLIQSKQKNHITFLMMGLCFSLPLMLYQKTSDMKRPDMWVYPNGESALFLDDASKIYSYYEVPANFVRSIDSGLSQEQIELLGPGFMVNDQLHYLTDYERVIKLCDAVKDDMTYLGMDGQGFYYYTNAKACGTGFIQAAKGYDAQNALLKVIKEKRPVVFTIDAQSNYYIYHYLLTNGYVYIQEDGALYPEELYNLIYQKEPDDYRETCTHLDLGLTPSSFGKSKDSLLELMTPMSNNENDSDFNTFKGSDYDFMTVMLDNNLTQNYKTLTVTFEFDSSTKDSHRNTCSVSCEISGDTLLIPMGMNPCWLLSDIRDIHFTALDANGNTTDFHTTDMDFKLYFIRK